MTERKIEADAVIQMYKEKLAQANHRIVLLEVMYAEALRKIDELETEE